MRGSIVTIFSELKNLEEIIFSYAFFMLFYIFYKYAISLVKDSCFSTAEEYQTFSYQSGAHKFDFSVRISQLVMCNMFCFAISVH